MMERTAKVGDTVLLPDGTFVVIHKIEQGEAYYGTHGHVRLQDLIPAANTIDDCWEIDHPRFP
jgi:hypothetical protein